MKPWPGRRARVLECGRPLPLSHQTAAAAKAPEDWRSPKAPAPSPRRADCIPAAKRAAAAFRPLVERAARLIGTAPEFDDLLKEVFGPNATHKTHGVTDPHARQVLRAEIDALVARLYDLTEAEFTHILGTFPLVDAATKQLTLNTYRDLEGKA